MNALGHYLLAGSLQAVGIIGLLTILSLLLPPFSYLISGAPLGLVTLRKGPVPGLRVLAGTFLLLSLFGYFARMGVELGAAFALGVWLPVWACAAVLRLTESQSVTLMMTAVIGVLVVLGLSLYSEELAAWWESWVQAFLEQNLPPDEIPRMQQVLEETLPLVNGVIAAGVVISLFLTVIAARWWQARMFNPGGFRGEFHRILLPRWMTAVTFLLLVVSLLDPGGYREPVRNLLMVLVVVHVFQGVASVHRTVAGRGLSRNWLFAMYGLLVLLPQMAVFIACIGMADALRGGGKSPPSGGEEV